MTHQELLNRFTRARLYVICEVSDDIARHASELRREVEEYARANSLEPPPEDWTIYEDRPDELGNSL